MPRSPRARERVVLECVLRAAVMDEAVGVERGQMTAFASHHDRMALGLANTNQSSSTCDQGRASERLAFLIALRGLEGDREATQETLMYVELLKSLY
jgi:hypothetical protein